MRETLVVAHDEPSAVMNASSSGAARRTSMLTPGAFVSVGGSPLMMPCGRFAHCDDAIAPRLLRVEEAPIGRGEALRRRVYVGRDPCDAA